MATTWADICRDALLELNVFNASSAIANDEITFVFGKAQRLIDNWNADREAVYADAFADYTFTPNLSPHTIGPGGTFNVTQRPISLDYAALRLSGSSNPYAKIEVRDQAWYQALTVPSLTSSIPTDVYYEPTWPLGNLYFYPVPTTALGVRLWARNVLSALLLTDAFSLPPGYKDAITLTLAEMIAQPYEKQVSDDLRTAAREARARVFGNNIEVPDLQTADAGMPGRRAVAPPGKTVLTHWM